MKNFFRDGGLAISIIALISLLLFMSVFTFMYSPDMFWILAPFIVLVSGFAIGKLIQVTRRNFQYSALITEEIKSENKMSLYSLPMGVVITDFSRKIVWYNKNFAEFFKEEAVYGNSIDVISRLPLDRFTVKGGVEIKYKDRYYRAYGNAPSDQEEKNIFLIYINDVTEHVNMQIEKKLSHPVVMLIMIDSFDELFSSSLESETAHVTVQIDRILEDFIAETTGLLRKQRDRFWAVVEERHIAKLIESKVKLLDKAREIQVNDRMNVTLSIGIGRTASTIAESEGYAKQALEMAQGRGGDQAAIKTASGFEFYGGVSKGVERANKIKARIIANQLIQLVEASDRVYIMGHKFSDLDSVGSSVGLACAIRNLGHTAHVVVDSLASLSTQLIDRLKASEEGKNSLFMSPSEAVDSITDNSLLIISDTHNPLMLESSELHLRAKQVVIIDHHRKTVNYIDNSIIFYHEPFASSASEMVTEILNYFGKAGKVTALQAEALLAGIMLDTKNFTIKTGVRTFEAAAFLRKLGADTVNVKGLFANSLESYRQKAALVSNSEIYKRCAIAYTTMYSPEMRLVAPQAADELLGIENVDASFVYYKSGGDEIYISARSLGALNVQLVMEHLGGGGHQTMAATQLHGGVTMEEAGRRLKEAIDDYYESLG